MFAHVDECTIFVSISVLVFTVYRRVLRAVRAILLVNACCLHVCRNAPCTVSVCTSMNVGVSDAC